MGIAAVRAEEARPSTWLLIAIAVIVALVGGRVSAAPPAASRNRLMVATGLSTTIAAAAFLARPSWVAIGRELAAAMAMVAALRAMGSLEGEVGLAPRASEAAAPPGFAPKNIVRAGIVGVLLVWAVAVLVDASSWAGAGARAADESSAPIVAALAGVFALVVAFATALLVGRVRRLELTVLPRALACAGATGVGLLLAVTFALSGITPADAAAALGCAVASAIILRVVHTGDALRLAQNGRRTLTLVVFGGPVAALAAIAVEGRMHNAGALALVLAAIALIVGAFASKLEEPFLPVKGILIDALSDAREAARAREVRDAMAHALVRLREASTVGMGPTAAPSPELWLLHPTRVLTVNAAGYLQERRAELPTGLFDVALGEPYATLRSSVLRALEVRRADLRPLLAWLDQRDALFATVIAESEDPEGLIVVPCGARTEELSLEESRAAKILADTFVAVSQAASAKVRHLDRERELNVRIEALDDDAARLRHALELEANRHALATTRLARPATVGIYSAASRMAYDALERRIALDAPTVLVVRAGSDPIAYVARSHLAGPRRNGPLVVVDGTSSREHDLERWTDDRTSPLALADRGVLMLVDGPALPREVQVLVARAVAERRPPWEQPTALDVGLVLSITFPSHLAPRSSHGASDHEPITVEDLIADGRLAPELAARFESGEPIVMPGLHDRPEDLRSIVADRLAREGLRVVGRPIGIDAGAFVRLVEYGFEGEDAELASITTKLVARVVQHGEDVVRAGDVDSLALPAPESGEQDMPMGPRALSKPSQG